MNLDKWTAYLIGIIVIAAIIVMGTLIIGNICLVSLNIAQGERSIGFLSTICGVFV